MRKQLYAGPWYFILAEFVLLMMSTHSIAQEMPPRPISVALNRSLNFGAFSQSVSGGTVTVDPSGVRNSSGDIVLVNMGFLYYPAVFELEGNPGTVVHFMAGPPATLTGSNGGSMTMTLGESEPMSPFILSTSQNGVLQVTIGGTLEVGSPLANPAGGYSGTFIVMFIQE